jgi:hypothetical protein
VSENFAALSVAVKIYTDAMRRLIRRRLEEAYGAEWWQRGVLAALNTEPRVRHGRPVEDNLDAHHFPAIITAYGNRLVFRDAFAALAHPRSYLELAGEARNQYQAHSRSGDIGNEDLLRLVGVMVAILDAANLSEVQEVRAIWQSGVERIGSQLSRDAAARDVLACSVCGASVPDQVPMLRDGAMIRATRAEFAQACENRFGRVLCEAHLAEWEVGSDPTEPAAELRVANAETGLERGDFLEVIFRGVTPTEIALEDPEEKRELSLRA